MCVRTSYVIRLISHPNKWQSVRSRFPTVPRVARELQSCNSCQVDKRQTLRGVRFKVSITRGLHACQGRKHQTNVQDCAHATSAFIPQQSDMHCIRNLPCCEPFFTETPGCGYRDSPFFQYVYGMLYLLLLSLPLLFRSAQGKLLSYDLSLVG